MLGFLLAFGTAISEALKDITSKFNLHHIDEYTAAFSMHLVQSILLAPLIFYFGFEELTPRFLWALLASSILQLIVILLYFKAIKRSELSVTVPLITLTPLFMLLTSPILIGEFPSLLGIVGIILIVVGTYISNISEDNKNFFAPFTMLVKEQGPRYMLLVAFIWSITANIDKIGVEETSPVFWSFSKDFVILFYLIPILAVKSKKPLSQINKRKWPLLLVGFFRSASVLTQMFAIQFILVAYVISIKRASSVFIILFAFFYMNERKNFRNRLIGIVIILIGLFVIAIS
ncbi:GRP family sugar transporter [Salegentibacter sp. F188]|uniref:GRP family sugar transporter n=1 Tax=Autumnicola patrickiae TaxID=3075591 RepID=A0ABU3E5I9_9FLAO|nr:GRP family sugar transporter [Salegentibacter sp. F188]MDT0690477.1 GRP family sugar transporter [Salegentibacter sp. F188]